MNVKKKKKNHLSIKKLEKPKFSFINDIFQKKDSFEEKRRKEKRRKEKRREHSYPGGGRQFIESISNIFDKNGEKKSHNLTKFNSVNKNSNSNEILEKLLKIKIISDSKNCFSDKRDEKLEYEIFKEKEKDFKKEEVNKEKKNRDREEKNN